MARPKGSPNAKLSRERKEQLTMETLILAMQIIEQRLPNLSKTNQETIFEISKRMKRILEL